ncbi:MAG: helix-turn-helix domain-containing protein [Planctomycetota bacterium]
MYTTVEVARRLSVCKSTLLRWIHAGLIPDVRRDWRGWRMWSERDINKAKAFMEAYHSQPIPRQRRRLFSKAQYAKSVAATMSQCDEAWEKRMKGPR